MRFRGESQLGKLLRAAVRELRSFAHRRPIPPAPNEESIRRPRLGVALGGGFARGVAHIGVLKVLVENQIAIDALAGISSGAIAAAAFASGCTIEEMTVAARKLRWARFARWTFPRLGFATNERMEEMLLSFLHCRTFERLAMPLAIVAADIMSGEAVIFREGDLIMPLRASCSFPGLFVPVEYQGRTLVDGALVGRVPVAALGDVDVVVAVDVQTNGSRQPPRSLFEIVGESLHFAQNMHQSLWRERCDFLIAPELDDFRWDDFTRADELIAAGEMAARKALPALRNILRERTMQLAQEERRRLVLTLPPAKNSPVTASPSVRLINQTTK